jgi:hypothetical protein
LRADGTFAAPAYPAAANPSAPLGLATVNGVATTYMRSDAAPALSQAITPTWTGPHVFTAAGTNASPTIELSSANPFLIFNETDGTTDNRRWKFRVDGESFQATVLNDANSVAGTWLNVERTGTAIDSAAFPTTANGSFLVGRTSSIAPGIGVAQISGGTATALCAYVTSAPAQALRCFSDVNIGNNYFVTFNTEANTERGSIIFNRGSGVVAYNTTSDRRRKKNIADAPSASDIVESLRVRAFDWKDSGNHVSHWLVAQEVHEVFPMAVSVGDEERDWAIDPAKLVPLLVKELQSLRARVATLEQRT